MSSKFVYFAFGVLFIASLSGQTNARPPETAQARITGQIDDTALKRVSYCGKILCMPRGNPSPKLAITVDPKVHEKIIAAAARDGISVSAWMTGAAREALQRRAGLTAIAKWEKQHRPFSAQEMDQARRTVRAQLRTWPRVRRPA